MSDPETAPCVNGPKLAAWLKERDRLPINLDTPANRSGRKDDPVWNLHRRVHAWAAGEQASLEAVDKWLTTIGCHISELPDDFWEDRKRRKTRNYSQFEKRRALQLLDDGLTPTEIARGLGCSPKSIAIWKKAAA